MKNHNNKIIPEFLAVIVAKLWMKSLKNCLQKTNDGRENKTLTRRESSLIVTDALPSEGKQSIDNHAKTGFKQNDKLSLARSIGTYRKFSGPVPIVQKNVQPRRHRVRFNSRV